MEDYVNVDDIINDTVLLYRGSIELGLSFARQYSGADRGPYFLASLQRRAREAASGSVLVVRIETKDELDFLMEDRPAGQEVQVFHGGELTLSVK